MERQYRMSQSRYDEMQEELEYLKTTRRAEVAKKIAEARELGDLAENEAYDAAKEEQYNTENRRAAFLIKGTESLLYAAKGFQPGTDDRKPFAIRKGCLSPGKRRLTRING